MRYGGSWPGSLCQGLAIAPAVFGAGSSTLSTRAIGGRPVVPIVISGMRSALRGGQWFPRPSNLSVRIAKAMRAGGRDFTAAVRLRDAVRARMLALCGEPDLALERQTYEFTRE
jgi:1-acyl-sn-glycerol-3-phosphate acyltransferase